MRDAWVFSAVDKIIDDLSDRRGLKNEWSQIDPETKKEIRKAWAIIIWTESKDEFDS